ncbi:MAG: hypothetical protein LLG01_12420 [Planctomycetaceae bacterium]|nr:hypothetical protein [Planctomycetaceae bacterium]
MNRSSLIVAWAAAIAGGIWLCAASAAGPAGGKAPDLGVNASLNGRRVLPADNPWNRDISREEADPDSAALVASIGLGKPLHPDFGTKYGIPYVVVAGKTPPVPVTFEYKDESDAGPYPIPPQAPIEGGPAASGDRHVLVIDRDNWKLYELFAAYPQQGGKSWKAGSGAMFDLNSNALRPAGWTSADAAGLPIFPGLVRYDEVVVQKELAHAVRFTCVKTRRAYVAPATHFASSRRDANLPPMGMRVRLKAAYDISGFPPEAQVILKGLKKYGMILADNGGDWFVTGAPHEKWNDEALNTLKKVKGKDFEVVKMGPVVTR